MKGDKILLSSAPSKEDLVKQIEAYWFCQSGSIALGSGGRIYRNGKAVSMDEYHWKKKGRRYRFEMLN